MSESLLELINTVARMKKASGVFTPYIDYMVFPKYRRVFPDEGIHFDFPLTVLIGRNGSGKSSLLQAIAGAPHGKSLGRFWFGTEVDPIDIVTTPGGKRTLTADEQARFWYSYKINGDERQPVKQRVSRPGDPDNWEPTRWAKRYGMTVKPLNNDRHEQIQMDSYYLNLRLYLSAFDRCFHFMSESTLSKFGRSNAWRKKSITNGKSQRTKSKKPSARDYIRHRSGELERAFGLERAYAIGKNKLADSPIRITPQVLEHVSKILGKTYRNGTIIHHRFYESWAFSVRFETEVGGYTEANAGSGETAVVMIVKLFEDAQPHSLLLLDEPETSLHPKAQVTLLEYILEKVKEKKLQVVISTHAPAMVKYLPKEAIKILKTDDLGLVHIVENVAAEDAFVEIGQEFDPKCNIVVEDRLTKELLEAVAKIHGNLIHHVRISFMPGGHTEMKKDIVRLMRSTNSVPITLFDGDQKRDHRSVGSITLDELNANSLDGIILKQTNVKIKFPEDSNMSEERRTELRKEYLQYYERFVLYLPFETPESAVWDDQAAKDLLGIALTSTEVETKLKEIQREADDKKKFSLVAAAVDGMAIDSIHAVFIKRFMTHSQYETIREELAVLLENALNRPVG